MTQLLDARTSQNKSYSDLESTTILPANTPTPIGVVGLNVSGASGVIRVQFTGIAELKLPEPLTIDTVMVIIIVRGTDLTGVPVANAIYGTGNTVSPIQVVTINASDYNVPYPPTNELIYTLFLFCTIEATRIGIESFNAIAFSD
ncbi:hypothetical protein QFZ77_002620 [Paenibacillus sp. V4I3]|uniref:hypothetical protein n=1 Tax=unclassified Paenibacillus TaxID=185978 RepID=UPI002781D90D|nr:MULTISPECIES: hypothetical protein [unclassified Paenibacillus]MDQ0873961.1 hypothetical protein [Paenibacillus sp. V4I3]MDQ0890164.1 hypothetical protein [Paenibacillus sp. V4I9]